MLFNIYYTFRISIIIPHNALHVYYTFRISIIIPHNALHVYYTFRISIIIPHNALPYLLYISYINYNTT